MRVTISDNVDGTRTVRVYDTEEKVYEGDVREDEEVAIDGQLGVASERPRGRNDTYVLPVIENVDVSKRTVVENG